MSNEITASITIGIPENFEWLNDFIESLYKEGAIYAQSINRLGVFNGGNLPKEDAHVYFEHYICQLQQDIDLPSIAWVIEDIGYWTELSSKPGSLSLTLYLFSDRMQQNKDGSHPNFQYYIDLLMRVMKSFTILEICMWYDDDYVDSRWHRIDGQWVGLKIKEPQPEVSFQILNIIIRATLTKDILVALVKRAAENNYALFPSNSAESVFDAENVINSLSLQESCERNWIYICNGVRYNVEISFLENSFICLIFRTEEYENAPHIDVLVNHACAILSFEIIEQVVSFDSRYNYLSS